MANFQGYLLKFGNQIFNNRFIQLDTYSPTPNQRTELSAYRDNNNSLHRTTSPNHKTTIRFDTIPLNLNQKKLLQFQMSQGLINSIERKYTISYWNDEQNVYITSDFYMPDVTYKIRKITNNDILYEPISYEFIEY